MITSIFPNEFLFLDVIGIIMMASIIIVYGLATFWNIKTFIITKTHYHSGLILFMAISCVVIVAVYGYILITTLSGDKSNITVFGTLIIRPSILLLGSSIASVARSRYLSFKHGGLQWILPNLKM